MYIFVYFCVYLNEIYFSDSLIEPAQKKKKTIEDDKKKHRKEKYSPVNTKEKKKTETETEIDGDTMKDFHVNLSPRTPGGDPPEPDEIIKALMVSNPLLQMKENGFNWFTLV